MTATMPSPSPPMPTPLRPPWVRTPADDVFTTGPITGPIPPPPPLYSRPPRARRGLTADDILQLRAISAGRCRPGEYWPRHRDRAELLRPRLRERIPTRALGSLVRDTFAALGVAVTLAAGSTALLLAAGVG